MAEKTIVEEKVLYNGDVVIHFYPNSHQYKLVKVDGKELAKKENLPSVTSITGIVDKSKFLLPWATRTMKERAIELLGENQSAVYNYQELIALLNTAENAPNEAKERAAGIGDYVHLFAEYYSQKRDKNEAYKAVIAELGEPTDTDKVKIMAGIDGLVTWLESNKIEILEAEQLVYSKSLGFVGTFDATIKFDGKTYLVDYKTSNGIYNEYYYQMSAYLKAKEEETGIKFDGAMLIGITKEDKIGKNGEVVKSAGQIFIEYRSRADLIKDYVAFKGLIKVRNREKELQAQWYANNK